MSAGASGARGVAARRAAHTGADGSTAGPVPGTDRRDGRGPGTLRRQLDPDALAALEEERDFLLRSIEDLEREHDAGDVDDADYAELTDDYTARAARVLRALDDRRALADSAVPRRSWVATAAWLAVVAVLAVGVGWFVFRDAGARAPGQGLSGDARQDSANLVLQAQGLTGQARAALEDGDTDRSLQLYTDALAAYTDALDLAPANVDALTSRGWLYHNLALGVGEGAEADELDGYAREDLAEAVAIDPSYGPARVFRAVLARDDGDAAAAREELAAADPDTIPSYMTTLVDQLRADVGAPTSSTPVG